MPGAFPEASAPALGEPEALHLPGLTGRDVAAAHAQLSELGLRTQVMAFDDSTIVTAQYPAPGAPIQPGQPVTLWLGAPPELPPPPEPAPETAPAADSSTAEPFSAQTPGADQPPEAPKPAQTESVAPPAKDSPTPARTSPRKQPPAEVGAIMQGKASWYGPGFEGRGTACGQKFDPGAHTLASHELRCGTVVKITGPSGKSVEATVNDWGPAEWTGRRFDLSRATFEAIHPLSAGVIDVTVEVVAP